MKVVIHNLAAQQKQNKKIQRTKGETGRQQKTHNIMRQQPKHTAPRHNQ